MSDKNNNALALKLAEDQDLVLAGRSLWQDARRRFFRNKAAVASLMTLFAIILFISFAPLIMPFSYEDTDWEMMNMAPGFA